MLRSNPRDLESEAGPAGGSRFVLYVEGPSDCHILRTWAGLVSRPLAHRVAQNAVILGGRRPARALEHFHELQGAGQQDGEPAGSLRGLCVLDRDDHEDWGAGDAPDGLDFFTWPRRHIESYLLVPTAMRRCLRMRPGDPRLDDLLGDLPRCDAEAALSNLDAKRFLATKATLSREFGSLLSSARIARCMNRSDLHADVLGLLERLRGM